LSPFGALAVHALFVSAKLQITAVMANAWDEEADTNSHPGLADLLSLLDQTSAAGKDADCLRKDRDPRIPKIGDNTLNAWYAPPTMEDVKEDLLKRVGRTSCSRRFKHNTPNNGEHFSKPGILPPKVLNVWLADNVANATPQRSIGNPPGKPGCVKYHAQSIDIPKTHDGMLHEQHGNWLKEHYKQREKHLYPVYTALVKVEKAVIKDQTIQNQRETVRDVKSRGQTVTPKFSDNVKNKLGNVKARLATTSQFNKVSGKDVVGDQEKKDRFFLRRAQSDPALELKPKDPKMRAKHLRCWKGPDRREAWAQSDSLLIHTTPGKFQEEEYELHNIPKYRARHPDLKTTRVEE